MMKLIKGKVSLTHDMGDLPAKRVLGVVWDTETDTFEFRVTFKQKSWTRRGLLSVISSVCDPLGLSLLFFFKESY